MQEDQRQPTESEAVMTSAASVQEAEAADSRSNRR